MQGTDGGMEGMAPMVDGGSGDRLAFVMRCLESTPLVAGEHWYLVSAGWLRRWQRYCEGLDGVPPGAIDNSDIIHPLSGPHGHYACVKEGALLDDDLVALPRGAWSMLVRWNGLAAGSRPILRPVVGRGGEAHLQIDLPIVKYRVGRGRLRFMAVPGTCTFSEFQQHFLAADEEEDGLIISLDDDDDGGDGDEQEEEDLRQAGGQLTFSIVKYRDRQGETIDPDQAASTPIGVLGFFDATAFVQIDSLASDGANGIIKGTRWKDKSMERGGICGLYNLGNTCFMNSALQCLSHCVPLTRYFLEQNFHQEINLDNPIGTGGQIARAYAALLTGLWSSRTAADPSRFKTTLGRFEPRFLGFHQQDAQELLSALLDRLHEDLNRVKQKPYVELGEAEGRPDDVIAREAWENHRRRSDSIIVDTFHGQFRSQVACPVCGYVSVTFDPFLFLSLPIGIVNGSRGDDSNGQGMAVAAAKCNLEVSLFSGIGAATGHKVELDVEGGGETVADMCQQLEVKTGIPAASMVVAEICEHQPCRILPPEANLGMEFVQGEIKVYQLEPEAKHCWVSFCLEETPSPAQRRFIGCPRLIAVTLGGDEMRSPSSIPLFIKNAMCRLLGSIVDADCLEVRPDEGRTLEDDGYASYVVDLRVAGVEDAMTVEKVLTPAIGNSDHGYQRPKRSPPPSPGGPVSIYQCLELFTAKERLSRDESWYCKQCKEHRVASKKMDLWRAPEILIIHLKRFSYSRLWGEKLSTLVEFPLQGLDLSKYLPAPGGGDNKAALYDLFAISHHYGGLGSGHYTATARHFVNGQWYHFDDSHVSEADAEQLEGSTAQRSAYLLFYQRRGLTM